MTENSRSSRGKQASFAGLPEEAGRLYAVLNEEPDLPCVLVAVSWLEGRLGALLAGAFAREDQPTRSLLAGPLDGLKARSELAWALGLLDPPLREDLETIAALREEFARGGALSADFASESAYRLCAQLKSWRALEGTDLHDFIRKAQEKDRGQFARSAFSASVAAIGQQLQFRRIEGKTRPTQAAAVQPKPSAAVQPSPRAIPRQPARPAVPPIQAMDLASPPEQALSRLPRRNRRSARLRRNLAAVRGGGPPNRHRRRQSNRLRRQSGQRPRLRSRSWPQPRPSQQNSRWPRLRRKPSEGRGAGPPSRCRW